MHLDSSAAIRDKEAKRRERKAAKAAKAQSEMFDGEGDESESDD
ncbi:MAG: hypothetical protein AB1Z98_09770 [Nannocystaceae bacterium]